MRGKSLPGASVKAFIGVWVCVALQQLALARAQGLIDGHAVVAHSGEDHRLIGTQVMVHAHSKQGLEQM